MKVIVNGVAKDVDLSTLKAKEMLLTTVVVVATPEELREYIEVEEFILTAAKQALASV